LAIQERLKEQVRHHKVSYLYVSGRDGSGESEIKHWQEMLINPSITVVQWHRLKVGTTLRRRKALH
jgi:hypothetical protein